MMQYFENHIFLNSTTKSYIRILFQYVFLPYCIGEQIYNSENYTKFIQGKGFEDFYNYISRSEELQHIVEFCIYHSTLKENRDIKRDMELIYKVLYADGKIDSEVKMKKVIITDEDKQYFYDLCTMLSDFTIE